MFHVIETVLCKIELTSKNLKKNIIKTRTIYKKVLKQMPLQKKKIKSTVTTKKNTFKTKKSAIY